MFAGSSHCQNHVAQVTLRTERKYTVSKKDVFQPPKMGPFEQVKYCPILLVLFGSLDQPDGQYSPITVRRADLDPWADDWAGIGI